MYSLVKETCLHFTLLVVNLRKVKKRVPVSFCIFAQVMAAKKEHKNGSQEKVKYHLGFTAMSLSRQECGMLCSVDLCCVPLGLNCKGTRFV